MVFLILLCFELELMGLCLLVQLGQERANFGLLFLKLGVEKVLLMFEFRIVVLFLLSECLTKIMHNLIIFVNQKRCSSKNVFKDNC